MRQTTFRDSLRTCGNRLLTHAADWIRPLAYARGSVVAASSGECPLALLATQANEGIVGQASACGGLQPAFCQSGAEAPRRLKPAPHRCRRVAAILVAIVMLAPAQQQEQNRPLIPSTGAVKFG